MGGRLIHSLSTLCNISANTGGWMLCTYSMSNVFQVATTLLVAGLSLTVWTPGQSLFASTNSYWSQCADSKLH